MARSRTSSSPQTVSASAETLGVNRWRVWAAALVASLVVLAMVQMWLAKAQQQWAEEAFLQAAVREKVAGLQVGATLAANLVPGALESLTASRTELASTLGQVKASGQDVTAVEAALTEFDRALAPVSGSLGSLSKAGEAGVKFSPSLDAMQKAAATVRASPALTSGNWGAALNPILQDLTRAEIAEMPVIFAPIRGGRALQRQWSDLFSRRARDLHAINELARKSPQLDSNAKNAVFALTQSATEAAVHAKALAETLEQRVAAQGSSQQILRAAESLRSALASTQPAAAAPAMWPLYLSWLLVLGVLGGMLFALIKADAIVNALNDEAGFGQQTREAIDRLTHQFKRILRMEGQDLRLDEPTDSPLFTLASMTNRLIDWRDSTGQMMLDQVKVLDNLRLELSQEGAALEAEAATHDENMQALARSLYRDAEAFAEIGEKARSQLQELQHALDGVRRSIGLAQEGAWKNDSLRENTQGTAKRIKRLGESTQGIMVASDFIREIARRILVLSVNGAIEAAGDNSERRQFGVISEEVQRLAQNAIGSLKEIEAVTTTMQGDAKETVATMEQSTAEVVDSGQLAARLSSALKDLERTCANALEDSGIVLGRAEDAALQAEKIATHQSQERSANLRQHVLRLNELVGRTREMSELLRRVGKGAAGG